MPGDYEGQVSHIQILLKLGRGIICQTVFFYGNIVGEEKRAVKIRTYDFDYQGTDENIPVITIELEWFDSGLLPEETADIMDGIDVSLKVESED